MAIYKGAIGLPFRATIRDENGAAIDVSMASQIEFAFRPPNSMASIRRPATFVTDGSDGKIQYATVDGDLSRAGTWYVQAFVTEGSEYWPTATHRFTVEKNL